MLKCACCGLQSRNLYRDSEGRLQGVALVRVDPPVGLCAYCVRAANATFARFNAAMQPSRPPPKRSGA